ncbi:MAG: peptide chain release factor N(5)-glutamine methyltransferase [Fidelibacterota bacterium]
MVPGPTHSKHRWRIIELIRWGEDYLLSRGLDHPRREIEWMLTDLLSLPKMELYLRFDQPVEGEHLKTLRSWIKRRVAGEPLAYITGNVEFFGLTFHVNPAVLIPRPETERLVEIALDMARKGEVRDIVDIGTGSGCIAVALGRHTEDTRIVAIDRNPSALDVARENARLNGVASRITFRKADVRTEDIPGPFDLLASNPPYIPVNEMEWLMDEVKRFEPRDALTDGSNGLEFYRRFAQKGRQWIRPGGFAVMEVGLGSHPSRVKEVFEKAGFEKIRIFPDYNGDDRVMVVEVNG